MNFQSKKSTHSRRFLKFVKIVAAIFVIVILGFFLIIAGGTYLFLSHSGKETISKKEIPEEVSAVVAATTPPSTTEPELPVDMSVQPKKRKPRQKLSPEQELARDNRVNNGIKFIKEIVELRKDSRLESAPPICDILCAPSVWEKPEGIEVWDYFNSFLEKESSRAFDDPKFRLAFELVNSYADILLVAGQTLEEIEPVIKRKNELSEAEKIYWSAKAPIIFARMATKMTDLIPTGKEQSKKVQELMKLNKQCEERSIDEIKEECQALSL